MRLLIKEASAYNAKLNQFLEGQPDDVQKFVKAALNAIFMGIKKDYDGYIEGKRATIKDFGSYHTLSMMIQANDVGAGNQRGKWSFIDPVKDYCSHLGKIFDKRINGDTYQCVAKEIGDLDVETHSGRQRATDQSKYAMVGVTSTGTGGSYKNLSKEVYGNTYSVIVSVPDVAGTTFENKYMTKNGDVYVFDNGYKTADGEVYSLTFDASDQEFHIRTHTKDSMDTFNILYKKSGKALKAFKKLVDEYDNTWSRQKVEAFLKDNGVALEHSWWFDPYRD